MLIVLEGCDGAGKTTLALSLAKILAAEIIHCTKDTPNDAGFFMNIIDAAKDRNIIADRFCYGQFVYQAPEERPLSESQLYRLEIAMLASGTKVMYVTAPEKEIQKRLCARGEIPLIEIPRIIKGYDKVWENSMLTPIVWYTGEGLRL